MIETVAVKFSDLISTHDGACYYVAYSRRLQPCLDISAVKVSNVSNPLLVAMVRFLCL